MLGTTPSGIVLGKVLTERDDPIVADFPELPVLAAVPVFRFLSTKAAAGVAPLDLLLAELRIIVAGGWHPSVILRPGALAPEPFSGNQGAGYTLEALLGVAANALHPETGEVVASWSLGKMADSWNAKHASAMYVPAEMRSRGGAKDVKFGSKVLVGEGTDVFRLLRAIHDGLVWYDPAHSIYADGQCKVRPHWRTSASKLEQTMGRLYSDVRLIGI